MFDRWPSSNALEKNINQYGGCIEKKVYCFLTRFDAIIFETNPVFLVKPLFPYDQKVKPKN